MVGEVLPILDFLMESLAKPHSLALIQGCGWWLLAAILLGMPTPLRGRLFLNTLWPAFVLAGVNNLTGAFTNSEFLVAENVDVHSFLMLVCGLLLAEFHGKATFSSQHAQAGFGVVCIAGTAFLAALPRDILHAAAHFVFGLGVAGIGLQLYRLGRAAVQGAPFPGCVLPSFALFGAAVTASYTTYYGDPVSFLTTFQTRDSLLSLDSIYILLQFGTSLCMLRWASSIATGTGAITPVKPGYRVVVAVLLLAVSGTLLARHLEVQSLAAIEAETINQARNLAESVEDNLREDERLTFLASRHPAVASAASGSPAQACDAFLQECASLTPGFHWFVTNGQGLIVSASARELYATASANVVSRRPYLSDALSGKTGRYFALGAIVKSTGHYTSQPVRDSSGRIAGAIVLKRPMSTLSASFGRHPHAMLLSPEGIIFLGSRREWDLKPLFPLPLERKTELERSGQFGAIASESLFGFPLPKSGFVRAFDREMLCSQAQLNTQDWHVFLMNDMSRVALSRHLPLALSLSMVILTLAFQIGTARVAEKAQQAVQFEQQFKSVFENAPEGILIVDADTHAILAANPFLHRALGIPDPERMKQLRYDDICPDGAGDAAAFFQQLAKGEPAAFEHRLQYSSGHAFQGEITGSFLKTRERNVFLLFIRDLTSRRLLEKMRNESEERFKKLFAAAPNGFILIREEDHTIVEVNSAALEMLGRPYEEVIGRVCHQFICPVEKGKCPISNLHQTIDHSERVLIGHDGERVPIIKQVIKLDLGGVPHLLENFIDIRQRKEMELALSRAKEAAEAASLEKGRFIAHMSHEIRTPMNALLGLIDVLHAEVTAPRQQHYLSLIRSAGESLLALLNDILDFSKIGAGRMELEESRFDLPALLQATLDLLSGKAAAKRIDLTGEIDPQLPRLVIGDQFRLRQVLLNLLNNAIKFTDEGSVRLSAVRLPSTDADAVVIAVEIRDSGIGIPADQISRLFESFSQIRSNGVSRKEGTGLGLTICRQLVRLMKGEISVTSEPGKGSTFRFTATFRLPEASEASAGQETPAVTAESKGVSGTILVAEDNDINRKLAEALLESGGWRVASVATGRELVERTAASTFDAVLADIQMPDMNGLEAARAVRAREARTGGHLPLIALTGNDASENAGLFAEAGFDGYLQKPFTRQQLFDVIADTLDRLRGGVSATIDVEHLMKRVCGDTGVLHKMIDIFLAKYPDQVAALERASAAGDMTETAARAHSLKGAIGTYASEKVFKAIGAVEAAARSGNPAEAAEALTAFAPLLRSFVRELQALQAKLRKESGVRPEPRQTS
ncbi:MAG TPA: ATP-binding protein [Candidatus Ozemobacteraceae bacterium]|nr:ATP-binding protein [Candidatus Ozemobacteraceae bacterium]